MGKLKEYLTETNDYLGEELVGMHEIIRIEIRDSGVVTITQLPLSPVASKLKKSYYRVSDLPEWIQRKIAVLSLLEPFTNPIPELGVKIDENRYWIYNTESFVLD